VAYFCAFIVTVAVGDQPSLQFLSPEGISIQDSIVKGKRERIVLSYTGPEGNLQAYWVVVVINIPYKRARAELGVLVKNKFGIEFEKEITARVPSASHVNPSLPKDPLFGDGFVDLRVLGNKILEVREFRIQSGFYHKSGTDNYSKSEWRVVDGDRLFAKACSVVVISRTDRSREWAWIHPGIPLPFKTIIETRLVTDTEIGIVETFRKNTGYPKTRYFVPYPGYKTNGALQTMTAIRDFAKDLP
jgi:hypothetical protein